MKHQHLTLSDITLSHTEIYLCMGYRDSIPDDYIRSLITEVLDEAATICIPQYMYRIVDATLINRISLQIDQTTFTIGKIIASYLPGMTHVCMFVATAGREYEAYLYDLHQKGDIVKEFVADAIGSAIVEACGAEIGKELAALDALKHSFPYSPGYCGWDIKEQHKLFPFFPAEPCGIKLSESSLMSPVKSISGFIGLGKDLQPQPYRCEICSNKHCYKRKERNNDKYENVGA